MNLKFSKIVHAFLCPVCRSWVYVLCQTLLSFHSETQKQLPRQQCIFSQSWIMQRRANSRGSGHWELHQRRTRYNWNELRPVVGRCIRVLHDVKRTGGGRPKAYQLSGRRPRRGESTRGGCPPSREKFFENKTVNNAFSWHLRTDFYKIARPNLNANPSVFRCKPTAPTTHWR